MANSRKYSTPWSIIKLNISQTNSQTIIEVIDEWIWILQDEIHFVVDKRFKGSNTNSSWFWLGLTKAYFYTKLYNWKFFIKSEINVWTHIRIVLPFIFNQFQD